MTTPLLTEEQAVKLAKDMRFRRHDGVFGMNQEELAAFANAAAELGAQAERERLVKASGVMPSFRLMWKYGEYKVDKPNIDDTDCYTPEAIATLQAKLEAAEKDAARYRFAKEKLRIGLWHFDSLGACECDFTQYEDADIDAAMKGNQP